MGNSDSNLLSNIDNLLSGKSKEYIVHDTIFINDYNDKAIHENMLYLETQMKSIDISKYCLFDSLEDQLIIGSN